MLEQDSGHYTLHGLGCIIESGIVVDALIQCVDFCDRQQGSVDKNIFLRSIARHISGAAANGRNHVIDAIFGYAPHIVALAGITCHEKTQDSSAQIRRCEPHAIAVTVARIGAGPGTGAALWCGSIEWWTVADCAPQRGIFEIWSASLVVTSKLGYPDLQSTLSGHINVVGHNTNIRTHFCGHAATIKLVVLGTSSTALYIF